MSTIRVTGNDVSALHAAYVEATGMPVRLLEQRRREAYEFLAAGFTVENLKVVVRAIRKGIGLGKRNEGALKWSNLVAQLERFEEDLLQAEKVIRPRPPKREVEKVVATTEGVIARIDEEDPAAKAPPVPTSNITGDVLRDLAAQIEKGGTKEP